jgi:O-antigen ligase
MTLVPALTRPEPVEPPPEPEEPALGQRRPLLDPLWPIVLLTVWMPVAYFVGIAAIVWVIPAFVFGIPMIRRRTLRVPGSILPLVALVLWIPITALSLPKLSSAEVFAYRWLIWASTVVAMLWLCNTSTRRVATKRIVDLLAALWIVLIFFGYLALLFPSTVQPSLLQHVMPQGLLSNQFIYDLTVVRFAELQTFVGGSVPRPAAPMEATNGWGSTLGLLTPFFILSWLLAPSARRRTIGWTIAALALVPLVISTNRGAWLSIAVALIYFAARRAFRGDARPLFAIVMLGTLVFACVLFTPLAGVVSTRLDQSDVSNADRGNLYSLAFEKTQASPIIGYGAPQSEDTGFPIGTHGLFWYVMFSHGFVGLAFLLIAIVTLTLATARARTPTALWAHICIVIALTQVPYYGLLPQFVLVGVAAGICWREDHPELAAIELA